MIFTADNHFGQFNSSHRLDNIASHCRALLTGQTFDTLREYSLGDVAGVANGSYRVVYTLWREPADWIPTAIRHLLNEEPFVLSHTIDPHNAHTGSQIEVRTQGGDTSDIAVTTNHMLRQPDATAGTHLLESTTSQTLMTRITEERKTIAVVGTSAVATQLVKQLQLLPVDITWLNDLVQSAETGTLKTVALHEVELDTLRSGAQVVVATGNHDLDIRFCRLALGNRHLSYVGCLGSAKKAKIIKERLLEEGIATELVQALHIPIGLPSIIGKQPAIVAASIVGQLLSDRHKSG